MHFIADDGFWPPSSNAGHKTHLFLLFPSSWISFFPPPSFTLTIFLPTLNARKHNHNHIFHFTVTRSTGSPIPTKTITAQDSWSRDKNAQPLQGLFPQKDTGFLSLSIHDRPPFLLNKLTFLSRTRSCILASLRTPLFDQIQHWKLYLFDSTANTGRKSDFRMLWLLLACHHDPDHLRSHNLTTREFHLRRLAAIQF